jgi:hypothetical protein
MKVCSKCKQEKPLTEFYAYKSSADGKQAYCKACSRVKSAAWECANRDKVRARQAAWRAANPDKVKAKWDAWRDANQEKVKAAATAWRAANPDKVEAVKERQRAKRAEARAAWLEANKEAITKPIKTPEEW